MAIHFLKIQKEVHFLHTHTKNCSLSHDFSLTYTVATDNVFAEYEGEREMH